MANMLFTNNAATTLVSGISNSATSLTVTTGAGALFPNPTGSQYFYCTLANTAGTVEIIKVTARSGDTFSTISRGQDGTSAVAWNAGDKVELRLVNADLTNLGQLDSANTWAQTQTFSQTISGNISGNAAGLSSTLAVGSGGTGQTSYTDGQLLIGNSTGNTLAKGTLTAGSGISVTNGPGAAITIASTVTSGQLKTQLFTSPGTWTNPGSVTQVRVLVIGAGGGSGSKATGYNPGTGGGGGVGYAVNVPVSGPVAVTIGVAGAGATYPGSGASGGTSSFGSLVSCTGGGGGTPGNPTPTAQIPGTPGSATISSGTSIVKSNSGNLNGSLGSTGIFHDIVGTGTTTVQSATAYSDTLNIFAGSGGSSNPTVAPSVPGLGGINGAVLVEFVG